MYGLSFESMAIDVNFPPVLSTVVFDHEVDPDDLYAYFRELPVLY